LPEKKRILYAFTGGRRARLRDAEAGVPRPTEFLYGFHQLRRSHYEVDLVEGETHGADGTFADRALNRAAARLLGIGLNTPAYVGHAARLADWDCLIATPDSCALAFARLKATGRAPNIPLIYLAMGLGAALERQPLLASAVRPYYASLLQRCQAIVALGQGEHAFLRRLFPASAPRIHFIPFGVDTAFWRPPAEDARDGTFLFVGNDPNRDFDLVAALVQRRPDLRFHIVSSHGALLRLGGAHVVAREGDWRRQPLSDDEMRQLYQRCTAVFLPLRESLQPSGQSVTLQAIACGAPVLITRTRGFWEPDQWIHGQHCYFVDGHDVGSWSSALDAVKDDASLRSRLTVEGGRLLARRYSLDLFARRLETLIDEILSHGRS
jgi:glycosyltransferase involved in cell wall biosynthesis